MNTEVGEGTGEEGEGVGVPDTPERGVAESRPPFLVHLRAGEQASGLSSRACLCLPAGKTSRWEIWALCDAARCAWLVGCTCAVWFRA